jgi:outer membrane protein with beta-barrel domain
MEMNSRTRTLNGSFARAVRQTGWTGWFLRILLVSLLGWFGQPTPAAAQTDNAPTIEVAIGPSLLRNGATAPNFSLYGGWQAEASGNFSKHVGVTADFSGEYRSISGTRISQYHYLFGPRFVARGTRATLFAHALVGAGSLRGSGSSLNGLALGIGGGVDLNVGRHFAIRLAQADYLPTRVSNAWFHDFRLGVGIVFKFGGQ